jgi:hypothetical protein
MHKNRPPREKRLFLVRREPEPQRQPGENRDRLLNLLDNVLIPLALVFCGIAFLAGYLYMNGRSEGAREIAVIFLPPITALMGAASAAYFRH